MDDETGTDQGSQAAEAPKDDHTSVAGTAASDGPDEAQLALERARDTRSNEGTRPPDGESPRLRSVTIVEMYAGQTIGALTTALSAMEWVNADDPVVNGIIEGQRGYVYYWRNFWLVADSAYVSRFATYALTGLPIGIDRIYGQYYVLGPSLVALALTFVLSADESARIDITLRTDAESRLDRRGNKVRIMNVQDVKREGVQAIRTEVGRRCCDWIKSTMPGTLSKVQDGVGLQPCALISLVQGTPFTAQNEYMTLIDLGEKWWAYRLSSYGFLYLAYPVGVASTKPMTGAFNEREVLAKHWITDFSQAPELFHQAISSLLIADSIDAVIRSYYPALKSIRDSLSKLDFEKARVRELIGLRTRLLGITPEILSVCREVTVLIEDAASIWSDLHPLEPLTARPAPSPSPVTAETKKRQLRAAVAGLESEESNLRELVLVTSTSKSDTISLRLAGMLNWMTILLLILTIVLVALGSLTLHLSGGSAPAVQTHSTVPSQLTPTTTRSRSQP